MDTKPIDGVLKDEYCQLLSIGYTHPSYDGALDTDGQPVFDEIDALYDAEKKQKAAQGHNGSTPKPAELEYDRDEHGITPLFDGDLLERI